RKSALQHTQAADADDGLDLASLDQRHDDRAAFRDENRIPEPLSFGLKILDGTQPTLFAEQPELIKRRRTFALHAKTFWKQQQPPFVRNSGQLFAPHFVVQ